MESQMMMMSWTRPLPCMIRPKRLTSDLSEGGLGGDKRGAAA